MNLDLDLDERIGSILKSIRKSKGFSKSEVSEVADINKSVLFNIENGKRSLNYENLYKLSKVYDISMDGILKREFYNNYVSEYEDADYETYQRNLLKARLTFLTKEEKIVLKNILECLKDLEKKEDENEK